MRRWITLVVVLLVATLTGCGTTAKVKEPQATSMPSAPAGPPTAEQARSIAKEAYIYGFPMVDSYRIQYSYFINPQSPE